MSDAILTVLFVGLSWWLWAKTQKWNVTTSAEPWRTSRRNVTAWKRDDVAT